MSPWQPGALVGSYRVDKVLGAGSMGAILKAHDTRDESVVALKVLSDEAKKHKTAKRRFMREAKAAQAVAHDNVVKILDVFEADDQPVIAMELLDGRSFEDVIVERGGRIPVGELARTMTYVTSAVGTAHSLGIVHRDLKPLNIFITQDGAVKVLDFGIAKLRATEGPVAESAVLTETGMIMGTPFYMAPEQATGEKHIDQRADVWAVGIILYRCLAGVIPTDADSFGGVFRKVVLADFPPLSEAAPGAPRELCDLVGRMLSRDPEARPWDLREVHEVLLTHTTNEVPKFSVAKTLILEEPTGPTSGPSGTAILASQERPSAPTSSAPLEPLVFAPGAMAPSPTAATPTAKASVDATSSSAAHASQAPPPGSELAAQAMSVPRRGSAIDETVNLPKRSNHMIWWIAVIVLVAGGIAYAAFRG